MGALPSAAARGHQLPLLELKAVQPAPTRPSTDSTPPRSQPGSSPAANTASERKTFKEHLPCPCQGRRGAGTWAQAPSLCFQEAFFFFRKLFLSIASLATVSAPASAPSFLHSGTSPGSIFPIPPSLCWNPALARQSHTKPPPSRTPSTFCLNFQELSLHTNL